MTESDKFKITIRVADIPEFTLTIKRNEEEFYRKAVNDVNKLWSYWKTSLNNTDSNRILAVIALKFAKQFYESMTARKAEEERHNNETLEAKEALDNFEKELDKILINFQDK